MTRFLTATALTLSTLTAAPALAEPIETLGDCYNAVITWCNETFPDHDCSQASGLDECDEVFGDSVSGARADFIATSGDPIARLRVLSRGTTRPASDQDDDDDDDDRGRREPQAISMERATQ